MTAIRLVRSRGICGRGWSLVALGLCLLAEAATFRLVQDQGDSSNVRWWLILVPLWAATVPVVLPHRATRIAAATVTACFCAAAALSVGWFFVPSLGAMILAVSQSNQGPSS